MQVHYFPRIALIGNRIVSSVTLTSPSYTSRPHAMSKENWISVVGFRHVHCAPYQTIVRRQLAQSIAVFVLIVA